MINKNQTPQSGNLWLNDYKAYKVQDYYLLEFDNSLFPKRRWILKNIKEVKDFLANEHEVRTKSRNDDFEELLEELLIIK